MTKDKGPAPVSTGVGPLLVGRYHRGRALSLAAFALLIAAPVGAFNQEQPPAAPAATPVSEISYAVVASYPHDPAAFTEGLLLRNGTLYESTGLEGQSDIRQIRLTDGKVLRRTMLPADLFGEGIVAWRRQLISVTWKSGIGYRWSLPKLKQTGSFRYPGEGWGMTASPDDLILSDGTAELRFLDPKSFAIRRRLIVTANGKPVKNLNELEWVDEHIFANIWQTRHIVRIDPQTGIVDGAIDVAALAEQAGGDLYENTPNGIAWDAEPRQLLVTGKRWNKIFALQLDPPSQ